MAQVREMIARGEDKTDWDRVRAQTDEDITRAVAEDPDTFIPEPGWFAKARVVMPQPKDVITLRVDHEVLDWFRRDGRGYQTRMNAVLKAFVAAQQNENRT